jgi:hypothetical protein
MELNYDQRRQDDRRKDTILSEWDDQKKYKEQPLLNYSAPGDAASPA